MSTASSGDGTDVEVPVSVIVPYYRARSTIGRALKSVMDQTMAPLEILVVDDASDDSSIDIVSELRQQPRGRRIRILKLESNRGPSVARNTGWNAAKGEYVAFLDADDAWHPQKIELQYGFMREHPDVSLCGHGHAFGEVPAGLPRSIAVTEVGFCDLLWRNRFVTPSAMLRRSVADRFREDQRFMEDHALWLQIAASGARVVRLELPLAVLYKPSFGAGGLSYNLLAMEKDELGNYRRLWRDGRIGVGLLILLTAWSLAKYLRRIAIVVWRRRAVRG